MLPQMLLVHPIRRQPKRLRLIGGCLLVSLAAVSEYLAAEILEPLSFVQGFRWSRLKLTAASRTPTPQPFTAASEAHFTAYSGIGATTTTKVLLRPIAGVHAVLGTVSSVT